MTMLILPFLRRRNEKNAAEQPEKFGGVRKTPRNYKATTAGETVPTDPEPEPTP